MTGTLGRRVFSYTYKMFKELILLIQQSEEDVNSRMRGIHEFDKN